MKICDMHTHSTFSDGTLTPAELLNLAAENQVSAIALCDHNTVNGLNEFKTLANNLNIEAVLGCELSTEYDGIEFHVLGLFIDELAFIELESLCKEMINNKQKAYETAVSLLMADGYDMDYKNIISKTPNGNINRTHIASALIEKGYIKSVKEGFDTILKSGGKYYTSPKRLDTLETISFLRKIGAVPVLAHPFYSATKDQLENFWSKAKSAGLVGIETIYPLYSKETTDFAQQTAKKYGFLQSGGSDFHGQNKPDIMLGKGKGDLEVPYDFYLKLKEFKYSNI